jgi:hypothetical protein
MKKAIFLMLFGITCLATQIVQAQITTKSPFGVDGNFKSFRLDIQPVTLPKFSTENFKWQTTQRSLRLPMETSFSFNKKKEISSKLFLPRGELANLKIVASSKKTIWEKLKGPYEDDKWFTPDKLEHIGYCFVISTWSGAVIKGVTGFKYGNECGVLVALSIGAYKEYFMDDQPSYKDMTGNLVGALGGYFVNRYWDKQFLIAGIPVKISILACN